MGPITDDAKRRVMTVLANIREEVDVTIPLNEDYTVRIESRRKEPVNRAWFVRVQLSTSQVIPGEDDQMAYIHEVDANGEAFIEDWREMMETFPWTEDKSWNFLVSKVYDCGDGVEMATYSESFTVMAEDVLETVVSDERVVRVEYSVPRTMYAVVDADVDLDDPSEIVRTVPNLGFKSLPLVDLEPEMVKTHLNPHAAPSIPTVGIEDVDDLSVTVVESEYATADAETDQ